MKKKSASVDVAQEGVTESKTVSRTLDKTGYVGGKEALAVTDAYNSEVWGKRGEVIICNLRLCLRNLGEYRRLTDVREADKTDLCEHL